jgi:hypothetical protein
MKDKIVIVLSKYYTYDIIHTSQSVEKEEKYSFICREL